VQGSDVMYGCLYMGTTNTKTPLTGLITRTRANNRELTLKTRQPFLPSPTWLARAKWPPKTRGNAFLTRLLGSGHETPTSYPVAPQACLGYPGQRRPGDLPYHLESLAGLPAG
jgi:hypothetical protein